MQTTKFIPYQKLSKKQKHEKDKERRRNWGAINPVTKKPQNSRVYDRKKMSRIDLNQY